MKTRKMISVMSSAFMLALGSSRAQAIDINGGGVQPSSNLVALYVFRDTDPANNVASGIIGNKAGNSALDLHILYNSTAARTWKAGGGLELIQQNLVYSDIAAATPNPFLAANQCSSSNGLTIELWLNNQDANDPSVGGLRPLPIRILSMSSSATQNNFLLSHNYNDGSFFQASARVGMDADPSKAPSLISKEKAFRAKVVQHLIFTADAASGEARLYLTDKTGNLTLHNVSTGFKGTFANWQNFNIGFGNELTYRTGLPANGQGWQGVLYAAAIYCKALTPTEILGPRAPSNWLSQQEDYVIDPDKVSTADAKTLDKAQLVYRRIVGNATGYDNPVLEQMVPFLQSPDEDQQKKAVELLTAKPGFYNRTVKDFAKKISNREEVVDVPFNDFAAIVLGHTKEGGDARELLFGNLYYTADPAVTAVRGDVVEDLILSNNQFEDLEQMNYDLTSSLKRINMTYGTSTLTGQMLYDSPGNRVINHLDPAGLISSRAFMSAHAVAGTNRRMVEFSAKEFLCTPIKDMSDADAPDSMVSRDVDRFPTGDHMRYQTTCRACHTQLDTLRPAFARITFEDNFVKHAQLFLSNPVPPMGTPTPTTMDQDPLGVSQKMNRNNTTFSSGFEVIGDSWLNNANFPGTPNAARFGWDGTRDDGKTYATDHVGMRSFGRLLAYSNAFPHCMAQKVFRSVCKRDPTQTEKDGVLNTIATKFKTVDGFKLKSLFERVVLTPDCLGQ